MERYAVTHIKKRVLLIEDNPGDAGLIEEMLQTVNGNFAITALDRLSTGLSLVDNERFDVVLLDLGLPDSDGIATLRKIQERKRELPVVVLTGLKDEALAAEAIALGAQDYLVKGKIDADLLSRSILYSIERKSLEENLRRRNAELREVNKELEAFSYSVAHDLRGPLRSMGGFSRILLKEYQDRLDEDGKDFLARIWSAAQKMDEIINDLLRLSKIVRQELSFETVDLSTMVRDIAAEYRAKEPDRGLEVLISEGMFAKADNNLVKIALENLFGNAWKFTSAVPHAKIEVGVTSSQGREIYYIKDNGIGFDMEQADRLFIPFQRLHTENEFPGTGIGLATVFRIIRRMGGDIWAEGELGKGAVFYFTLR